MTQPLNRMRQNEKNRPRKRALRSTTRQARHAAFKNVKTQCEFKLLKQEATTEN